MVSVLHRSLRHRWGGQRPGALFVDSENGADGNAGTQTAPLQTLAAARTKFTTGTLYLARGSRFYEELADWPAGCKIRAYGSGDRPIIDGRELATDWELHDGDIWRTAWTHDFGADGGKSKHRVWMDGVMMQRAASLEALESAPGSFWADAPTEGGPDWIYVHADPSEHELLITKRRYCVQLYDTRNQADIESVMAIGNAFADGAFCTDGRVVDCIARDGRIHNFFVLGLAEDCQALGTETTESFGMFVSYYASHQGPTGRDTVYRRCVADAQQSAPLGVGFEAHTDGVRSFGTLQFEDCESIGCNGGYSGTNADTIVYYRCAAEDCTIAYLAVGLTTIILGGETRTRNVSDSKLINYATGFPFALTVRGCRVHKQGGGFGPIDLRSPNLTATVERCTLVGATTASNRVQQGTVTWNKNIAVSPNMTGVLLASAGAQIAAFSADANCYWSSGHGSMLCSKQFGGHVDYVTIGNWRTYLNGAALGVGREATSLGANPQIVDAANGDFTIGNATVLALGAGAELDEEDDPELQALWELYRVA